MKKHIFSVFLFILSMVSSAFAEDTDLKKVNISLNPLGFIFGIYSGDVDIGITENVAVGPTFQYFGISVTNGITTARADFIGFGVSAKLFLGHPRFTTGFFLDPTFSYNLVSVSGTATLLTSAQSTSSFAVGAAAGYWWFWNGGLNLGLGLSGNYAFSGRFSPGLFFNFGYAF